MSLNSDEHLKGVEAFVFGTTLIAATYAFGRFLIQSAETVEDLKINAIIIVIYSFFMLYFAGVSLQITIEKFRHEENKNKPANLHIPFAVVSVASILIAKPGGFLKMYHNRISELTSTKIEEENGLGIIYKTWDFIQCVI